MAETNREPEKAGEQLPEWAVRDAASGQSAHVRSHMKAVMQSGIEKLFGDSFEIGRINEGDVIQAGGNYVFSTGSKAEFTADLESFRTFFERVRKYKEINIEGVQLEAMRAWLVANGVDIDAELFAHLVAFSNTHDNTYPHNSDRATTRESLYKGGKKTALSNVFHLNCAECAEIAALAQGYLQTVGIPSSYFSGYVLWEKGEDQSGEAHSFLIIRTPNKTLLFDPANPIHANGQTFPRISETVADFDAEVRRGTVRFVTATDLLTKSEAYYGVSDGTIIDCDRRIV